MPASRDTSLQRDIGVLQCWIEKLEERLVCQNDAAFKLYGRT